MHRKGYVFLSLGILVSAAVLLCLSMPSAFDQSRLAKSQPSLLAAQQADTSLAAARVAANFGQLPLRFEANQGQVDRRASFLARGRGYSVLLENDGLTMILDAPPSAAQQKGRTSAFDRRREALRRSAERAALEMRFVGANSAPVMEGAERQETRTNYLLGNDPQRWHTNVPSYGRVQYSQIYPGVDLVYYGQQQRLEYDFVVAPGRDPGNIRMRFSGAQEQRVDQDGALVLTVKGREVRQMAPKAYQEIAGQRRPVEARYVIRASDGEVRFALGAYDPARPLTIDPAIVYSTYFGGTGDESARAIAVDGTGNVYLTGFTTSAGLGTAGAFQSTVNASIQNAFVMKLNATATAVTYFTYLGGTIFDEGDAIAVDAGGNAYVGGLTGSADFPVTAGAAQFVYGGSAFNNGYLCKLNATGTALTYATFMGGNGLQGDGVNSLFVDGAGAVYATGFTTSANLPVTAGVLQTVYGGSTGGNTGDAFVVKLAANGTSFTYLTYLGGASDEVGFAIQVDGSGNAYVAGDTQTNNFPTTAGVIQTAYGGGTFDGFIAEVNPAATALVFYTYFGGPGDDHIFGMSRSAAGNLYLTGATTSTMGFPSTAGAAQPAFAGGTAGGFGDAFVAELNSSATSAVYFTYLGGTLDDAGSDIKVDATGFAYVAGFTTSTNFPFIPPTAFQTANGGGQDAFIAKLRPGGTQVVYASYHGGAGTENVTRMVIDASGAAYFTGDTNSNPFPTTAGVVQTVFGGGTIDTFVAKFDLSAATSDFVPTSLVFASQATNTSSAAQNITYTNIGNATLNVASITTTGDFSRTTTCGATILAGANCTISVTFTPTATGMLVGSVIVNDSATGSPHTLGLTGTGVAPAVVLSSTNVVFGNQNVGSTSAAMPVTLTNNGTSPLNITGFAISGGNAGDFGQTNTCGTPPVALPAGMSCTINFTFSPSAANNRASTFTVTDDAPAPGSTQAVALSGTGVAPAGGDFTITTNSNLVTILVGGTATFSLSLNPIGNFTGTVTLTCTGAPALTTCAVPPPVTLNGFNSSSAAVVFTTTGRSSTPPAPGGRRMPPAFFLLLAAGIAALAALFAPLPTRLRLRYLAPALAILALTVFGAACVTGSKGTQPGTYPLVVNGTSGALSHSINLTVIVR
jgi:hypothetical protein